MNLTSCLIQSLLRSRGLALRGTVAALLSLCSLTVWAAQEGPYVFEVSEGGAEITKYIGPGGEVLIPEFLGNQPVVKIGDRAFAESHTLVRVRIPDRTTQIGNSAFAKCSGLVEIDLGRDVDSLGELVFLECSSLEQVVIPARVRTIPVGTFAGCSRLRTVELPPGLTSIGAIAFELCSQLTRVELPDSVVSVEDAAFLLCRRLTEVHFGLGLASIGRQAFSGCANLSRVEFPVNLIAIGAEAFAECVSLTHVELPPRIKAIEPVTFFACSGLTQFTMGDSVTSIGSRAFGLCTNLTRFRIPAGVTSVAVDSWTDCYALRSIEVADQNPAYQSLDGVLLSKDRQHFLVYPPARGETGDYTVPEGVVRVANGAFSSSPRLSRLIFPSSLVSIGDSACFGCSNLRNVVFGEGLVSMGDRAFAGCTSLMRLSIPASLTTLGGGAIPDWTAYEVAPLNSVYSSRAGVLFSSDSATLIRCPTSKSGNYTVPDSVRLISDRSFYGCVQLKTVTIGHGVYYIGGGTFWLCSNLAAVYFPGNPPYTRDADIGLSGSDFATVFRLASATGWEPTYMGRPTAIWTPPVSYAKWIQTSGLTRVFPDATGEDRDPDGDGQSNRMEWESGTDPTLETSALRILPSPATDPEPLPSHQVAIHFQSLPGHRYVLEGSSALGDPMNLLAVLISAPGTSQSRFVQSRPPDGEHRFYRVLFVQ